MVGGAYDSFTLVDLVREKAAIFWMIFTSAIYVDVGISSDVAFSFIFTYYVW